MRSLALVAVMGAALALAGCKSGDKGGEAACGCAEGCGCEACGCEGCGCACAACGCEGCGCEGCGCGGCGCGGGGKAATVKVADKAAAQRLFNAYRSWRKANTDAFRSKPHGNMMVTNYVNGLADRNFTEGKGNYAPGAAIGKVGTRGGKVLKIWFMEKRAKGYDSKNGDWYYAQLSANGKVDSAGQVQSCVQCHSMAGNDYVYGLPK